MTLKNGESYAHTIRLDRWRAVGSKLGNELVLEPPFRQPGTYKVEAKYAAPVGFKNIHPATVIFDWPFWVGELTSNVATIEVKPAAKK